jgi:hypothetical protein
MPAILVNNVVDIKKIMGKRGLRRRKGNKGSLTQKYACMELILS